MLHSGDSGKRLVLYDNIKVLYDNMFQSIRVLLLKVFQPLARLLLEAMLLKQQATMLLVSCEAMLLEQVSASHRETSPHSGEQNAAEEPAMITRAPRGVKRRRGQESAFPFLGRRGQML